MSKEKILVIDDETGIRSSLQGILEDEGYLVKTTETGEKGLALLRSENFDLIMLDIWLPEKNGIEILEKIKIFDKNIQVIMISGHGSIESAVKATKLGAFDFLEKPLTLEKVVLTAKNALKQSRLEEENILLREKLKANLNLVGKSPAAQKIREAIKTAAESNGRVLITGENGTGKELVARLIHSHSSRRDRRFVQFNIGAIPDELIEKELLGYAEGVFPEAPKERKGKLLASEGGVLFLDEVGDMTPALQAKLAGIIEEGSFEPIGSAGESIPFESRLIAATDLNLKPMIEAGKFREDLYYKLNVLPIHIPPLRERKEDIPLLIEHYLKYYAMADGKKEKTMSPAALEAFINYSWPGNISELINVIERFVIMVKEEEIREPHISLLVEPIETQYTAGNHSGPSLKDASRQFERDFIHKTLVNANWNLEEAAEELDIEPPVLHQKIKELGISFAE